MIPVTPLLFKNSLIKGKQTVIGMISPLYSLVTGRLRDRTYLSAKQKNNFIGVKPLHILPSLEYSGNFLPFAGNHGHFEGRCAIPVFRFISINRRQNIPTAQTTRSPRYNFTASQTCSLLSCNTCIVILIPCNQSGTPPLGDVPARII